MKMEEINEGDKLELDCFNKDGNPITAQFEVLEVSYYPSKDPDIFFPGAKCRFENGAEDILPFVTLEFARKANV